MSNTISQICYNYSCQIIGQSPTIMVGGKSGHHRGGQLLTATKSNLRESATETKLPKKEQSFGDGEKSGVRAHN